MAYLNKHNLLSRKKGLSTELTIVTLTNETVEALDDRKAVVATFCDLSKTFDCVVERT